MSTRLFGDDVVEFQRLLKSSGFLKGALDGVWGAQTDKAAKAFENFYEAIKASGGSFDARSESCILTLNPKAQELARQTLNIVRKSGIDVRIISGTRSYREQDALFRKGRYGSAGLVVTNARGRPVESQLWDRLGHRDLRFEGQVSRGLTFVFEGRTDRRRHTTESRRMGRRVEELS